MKMNLISKIMVPLLLIINIAMFHGCGDSSNSKIQSKTLSSIIIQPKTPDNLLAGETLQFTATGAYSDGSVEDISPLVSWRVSDTVNTAISKSGLLTITGGVPPPGSAATDAGATAGVAATAGEKTSAAGSSSAYNESSNSAPDDGLIDVSVIASLSGVISKVVSLKISLADGPSIYLQSGGTENKSGQNITVSDTDKSAVKVTNKGTLYLRNSSITTTGNSTSAINSAAFGLNAAVLTRSYGKIDVTNTRIITSGTGAAGIFAGGKESSINAKDVKIKCSADGARGINAAQGGDLTAMDINILVSGADSPAIATDAGGGTIAASHVTARTTSDKGSPCIYVDRDGKVTVSSSNLKAEISEGAVITGNGILNLKNTDITGGICGLKAHTVMETKDTGSVTISGGSITATEGDAIIVTGTKADITVEDRTKITFAKGYKILNVTNSGSSVFTAAGLKLNGDLAAEEESSLAISLNVSATLTGIITNAALTIDPTSQWIVKGDSTLTDLDIEGVGKIPENIKDNGYTIYYDSNSNVNTWLRGETYDLSDGGKLTPK